MGTAVPLVGYEVPRTYQEWLECFSYLKLHPEDYAYLRRLRGGTLMCNPSILNMFLQRLDDTVGEILNHAISTFLSRVDEAFEESDFDAVEILAIRFWKRVSECFFFESVKCIPGEHKRQFREGYQEQLNMFWRHFLEMLAYESEQSDNQALDELAFQLRRIGPEGIEKGMQ